MATTVTIRSGHAPVVAPELQCDLQPAITFWRGRVALYAILRALGIGPGDAVVVPGYTCFAVPSAAMFTGAQPIYADIEPETFNVSLRTIEAACAGELGRVKAVVVQHTYGLPADIQPIVTWARKRGIFVIEDCAHALGSRYCLSGGTWREVGEVGDAAFFSSQWTKPVSTGLGGWARATNPIIHAEIQRFHDEQCCEPTSRESFMLAAQVTARQIVSAPSIFSIARSMYQALYRRGLMVGTSSAEEFRAEQPSGYSKRMSPFQQRLLRRRMNDPHLRQHGRKLRLIYDAALESFGMATLSLPHYADPVLLRYPVRVRGKAELLAQAQRRFFEIGDWYSRPVDAPADVPSETFGYEAGMCPEGERAACDVVNLPMHTRVDEKRARKLVEFVREFA